jgi:hypothetical protein
MAFKLHRLSGSPRCLNVEWHGDVCAVSFRNSSLDESWIEDMAEELLALIDRHGSRKLVVSLSGNRLSVQSAPGQAPDSTAIDALVQRPNAVVRGSPIRPGSFPRLLPGQVLRVLRDP